MRVKVKALSVNQCWRGGRRYRTDTYEAFEKEVLYQLKKHPISSGKLFLSLTVGVSNKRFDLDNAIKPFLDVLQKKYNFDDNQIYGMEVWKEDVLRGEEFIDFDLWPLE